MTIVGLRDDSQFGTGQRPENWRQGILMLEPNGTAPLYALTSMMSSESTDDPLFHWFEEDLANYRMAASADILIGDTVFPVVSGALALKAGDILRVEQSNELVYVAADPTSDTSIPAVVRGFAGSTAAAIDYNGDGMNPNFMLMGSSYEEGSVPPAGRTFNPDEHNNYTQIFRDTFGITGTTLETNTRTGDTVKEDKRRCLTRHSQAIEMSFIFGRKNSGIRNGKPWRTMDGVIAQIPAANITTPAAGQWSMTQLENYFKGIFTYGSNEKVALCGNSFVLGVNQACRLNSNYQLAPMSKEYGMNVQRVMTPFGVLVLKTHPLFNQVSGGTTGAANYTGLDSWGLICDMKFLKYRFMRNRDTKYETDLEIPGTDGKSAGYLTECGIQLSHPKTWGLVKGLTAGVKDA